MQKFNRKLFDGFAWEAVTRVIAQIASWVSTIWVARLLTPEDYGLVAISGIFTGLCLTISGMGLGSALVNKKELTEYDMANVFWTSFVLAMLFYAVLYISSPHIANHYSTPELNNILRVAGIMILASPISVVPRALIMRQLRFKVVAFIRMVAHFIVIFLTLFLAFNDWGYWSLIISTVTAELFNLSAYMMVARYWPKRPREIQTAFSLYNYGLVILGTRIVAYLNSSIPIIITGQFLNNQSTGHFQMSRTLAKIPMSKVGDIFGRIAFPAFSRLQDDLSKAKQIFLLMQKYLFMIIAPMFVGIAVIAADLVPFVLGDKWLDAIIPIQILCVTNIIAGSAMIVPRLLEGLGKAKASFKYESIVALITLVSMLFGVRWGLNGMLFSWAAAFPLSYIYLLSVLMRSIDMQLIEYWHTVSTTAICVAIMCLAIYLVDKIVLLDGLNQFDMLVMKIVVGVGSYTMSYIMIGAKDIRALKKFIKNRNVVV